MATIPKVSDPPEDGYLKIKTLHHRFLYMERGPIRMKMIFANKYKSSQRIPPQKKIEVHKNTYNLFKTISPSCCQHHPPSPPDPSAAHREDLWEVSIQPTGMSIETCYRKWEIKNSLVTVCRKLNHWCFRRRTGVLVMVWIVCDFLRFTIEETCRHDKTEPCAVIS